MERGAGGPVSRNGFGWRLRAVVVALAGACSVLPVLADPKPDPSSNGVQAIAIKSQVISDFDKIALGRTSFGALTWIGGVRLTSGNKSFGGWSGLVLDADGRGLIAVSDAGSWLTGEMTYRDGRPVGVKRARIGPLLALNGRPLRRGRDRDAEAIVLVDGTTRAGKLLIAFEQNHRIGRFRIGRDGIGTPSSYVEPRRPGGRMSALRGFEAATVLKGGANRGSLVAIAERKHTAQGHHSGWIWIKGKPRAFSVVDIGGHDITDVAALPDGGVILLERRFRWLEGITFRLRHVPAEALKPGAVVGGEVLIEANLSQNIDNMEGLAIHRDGKGGFVLTVLSDDNFNPVLQQTLLLQFRWQPGAQQVAR